MADGTPSKTYEAVSRAEKVGGRSPSRLRCRCVSLVSTALTGGGLQPLGTALPSATSAMMRKLAERVWF
ncbi:MAG: hypothetical protein ABWK05_08670 [Pyrobaculum sp.]